MLQPLHMLLHPFNHISGSLWALLQFHSCSHAVCMQQSSVRHLRPFIEGVWCSLLLCLYV